MRLTLTTLLTPVVATFVAASGALVSPASADHEQLPGGRHIEIHTVQPGDTATGLAVRYHAWTAELIAHNHLGAGAVLTVGDRIEIPVVTAAVPSHQKTGHQKSSHQTTRHQKARQVEARADRRRVARTQHHHVSDPSRQRVRAAIVHESRRQGVDPQLSLAVSWQESGWQMDQVSSAGAIGAMQVLRPTVRWMELYAGRDLRARSLRDNVETGVTLLDVLAAETVSRARQVGAYYQGLGAVRRHGLYDETRTYVDNVLAIKHRLERGQPPA